MTYVVVPSPAFHQLLCYHISEAEQEATRCALRQHWPSDECRTVKMSCVILPRLSRLSETTHLYARSMEAMMVEVAAGAQPAAQSRSPKCRS